MNVSFKMMRRFEDKVYILAEISDYDEGLPVILTASTEDGTRVPSDVFPFFDRRDPSSLEGILYDAALAHSDEKRMAYHAQNSAAVRFFVIVLPWLSVRRWVLEFRAINAEGKTASFCINSLDADSARWISRFDARFNRFRSSQIDKLDGRFIHDRIRISFVRALQLEQDRLVTAVVEMPFHEESIIEFDFLDQKGLPITLYPQVIEDSVYHPEDYGALERRYMLVTFRVPERYHGVCFCVTDTKGNITPAFEMLGEQRLERLIENFEELTKTAYVDQNYNEWFDRHSVDLPTLLEQVTVSFDKNPLISIVCPLNNTPQHHVHDVVNAFLSQSYGSWELIFVDLTEGDDSSVTSELFDIFDDERIYLFDVDANLSTVEKLNAALYAAEGEFIGTFFAQDALAPDALFEYVRTINEFCDVDVIYCDADTVDAAGVHSKPAFRPDFSPELLRSYNYMKDFLVIRTELLMKIGLFSTENPLALDYDLTLRAAEKARRVCHVARVLVHRRYATFFEDEALFTEDRQEAGRRALVAHCRRVGIHAEVLSLPYPFKYRIRHVLVENPKVTIVIASQDNGQALTRVVRALREKLTYRNYEIVIVDAASADCDTKTSYQKLQEDFDNLKVLYWDQNFNYARIANFAADNTVGEFLLYLSDDTRVLTDDALEVMLGYFQSRDVGIVGAQKLYLDGTIEHAGLVIGGDRHVPNFIARYMNADWPGYLDRNLVAQNLSAVTGDSMMVRRSVFDQVGGFTEDLSISYSDVDFCLKAKELGFYTVYTPYASLTHFSSVSRIRNYSQAFRIKVKREAALLQYFWPSYFVRGDAYYSPNLDPKSPYFALLNDSEDI